LENPDLPATREVQGTRETRALKVGMELQETRGTEVRMVSSVREE